MRKLVLPLFCLFLLGIVTTTQASIETRDAYCSDPIDIYLDQSTSFSLDLSGYITLAEGEKLLSVTFEFYPNSFVSVGYVFNAGSPTDFDGSIARTLIATWGVDFTIQSQSDDDSFLWNSPLLVEGDRFDFDGFYDESGDPISGLNKFGHALTNDTTRELDAFTFGTVVESGDLATLLSETIVFDLSLYTVGDATLDGELGSAFMSTAFESMSVNGVLKVTYTVETAPIVTTPEPATMALFGLAAIGGLPLARRLRRN